MFLDPRLWRLTEGVRGRIALAVLVGVVASSVGVARFALLGWLLGMVYRGAGLDALIAPAAAVAAVMVLRGLLEYSRAMVAHEEFVARVAQEQNSRVYLLSIVAAIFLPLSFLTGLFGMNVAGLPGMEDPRAFLLVTGIMLGLAVVALIVFRWKRWI